MKFKSLCFPRTNFKKEFDERLNTRGLKGRVFGWVDPLVQYYYPVTMQPASASNPNTRKGFIPNSSEIKTVLGVSALNFTTGRFRLQFVNASGRNAFLDTVKSITVNGYEYDLSGFYNQSTKNLETKTAAVRTASMSDIDRCEFKVTLK